MNADALFPRYQELQSYVGWTDQDAIRVARLLPLLEPALPELVEDFYREIHRHPGAAKVITGGEAQVQRLKGTLLNWLRELLHGVYDHEYVSRRWRVGWRHVEIGLDQVYTNVALSRLRRGLVREVQTRWQDSKEELQATVRSLNTLLDLDLAIIEDAYQSEYLARHKRMERLAAKARSEAAFRTLVEAAPCLILLMRPDRTLLYFNRFAEEVTGYSASEVLGRDYVTTFLPSDHQQDITEHLRRLPAGHAVRAMEFPLLCRDGSRRWVLWNAESLSEPLLDQTTSVMEPGTGPTLLVIGQDITALKHSQERTLQAERLAAIGQMMTGLAHESGNALARSQACLEMLSLEVQDRPEALELLSRIQKAQNHLQQLYDEVRNYAAPLKLEREFWSVQAVWRQAWANLAVRREGRQTLLKEKTREVDVNSWIDPFRMEQVFRNIFENALAACTDPVEIEISCCEGRLEGKPALHVIVRDNGPGLTPEVRRRLFEPFFTTKTKGTGLGMAIARRIVEAHGGQIHAETGPGAVLHILLPRESS